MTYLSLFFRFFDRTHRCHLSVRLVRQCTVIPLLFHLFLRGLLGIPKHVLEPLEYVQSAKEGKRYILADCVVDFEERDVEDPLEQSRQRHQLLQGGGLLDL